MSTQSRFDISRWPSMQARWRPEQVAIREGETARSYRELAERIDRLANALSALGVGFGDRVALLALNSCEVVEIIFATARLGAMAVPLNFRLASRELAFMLRDCTPSLLFFDPTLSALVEQIQDEEIPPTRLIEIGPELEQLIQGAQASAPTPSQAIEEETPHLIIYTAGTTGSPKGVMLSHGNTFWQVINAVNLGLLPGAIGLAALPFFHIGGLNGSVTPLLFIGGTTIIQRQFDPKETIRLFVEHEVQGMLGVPAIFLALAATPEFHTADLSKIVAFTSGGAPLPMHTIKLYEARGIPFRQGYGLTEAAPGVTGMEPQDAYNKPGSVGRACHHTELRVVKEGEIDCAPGERGEVIVRGPNVMLGYWNRPEATAEALKGGWLRTGDMGAMDIEGYLYVYGRQRQMIISGGENIYPAEIVNAITEHPAVIECAVLGVDDERWGQRPAAFVVKWPQQSLSVEELERFLESRLARFKRPRDFYFLPILPRSAAGKVLNSELQKLSK